MLYLAIPAHNEAATIGVLLWRLRTVLAEFPREYEAVVYDDASSDSTSEILESYSRVMPLTVLRGERQVGYAGAVDALVRHVARDTRYPRRDAMLLLQGDFTDSPQLVPEFVKRFEGGTDVVVGERGRSVRRKAPAPVKRLLQVEPWLTRFLVRAEGIRDLTSSYRLVRISVLRDLLRNVGDAPVCAGDSRTANADFTMRLVPLARRVEALPVEPTWEVRLRETRVVAFADSMNLLRWAWRSRGKKAVPSTAPESAGDMPRNARGGRDSRNETRPDRPEWSGDAAASSDGRSNSARDANGRNRKPRNGRPDEKREARNEPRSDARNEPRTQNKNAPRPPRPERPERSAETRPPRPEQRPRLALQADAVETDAALNSGLLADGGVDSNVEAPRERPPRRKRSRGGRNRGQREGTEASTEGNGVDAGEGTSERFAGSREQVEGAVPEALGEASVQRPAREENSIGDEPAFTREIELSPSLSDAVADVEMAFDEGERSRPPRKKRRRRGSRGGGRSAGAPGAEDTADGAGESAAMSGGDAGEYSGSDGGDFADGDAGSAAEGAGASEGGEGEGRVRRRGRRGRRGGSRRSRGNREGGESSSAGEDFSPPSAPSFEE